MFARFVDLSLTGLGAAPDFPDKQIRVCSAFADGSGTIFWPRIVDGGNAHTRARFCGDRHNRAAASARSARISSRGQTPTANAFLSTNTPHSANQFRSRKSITTGQRFAAVCA